MKHTLYLLLPAVILFSCGTAKQFPAAPQQQIVINSDETGQQDDLLITETFDVAEAQDEELRADNVVRKETFTVHSSALTSSVSTKEPVDTLVIDEDEDAQAIARDSERVAKNARVWSFMPLAGLFFLPLILIGIVGGLITISRFKRYAYITEKAQGDIRKARKTLLATSLIVIGIYLLIALFFILIIFSLSW